MLPIRIGVDSYVNANVTSAGIQLGHSQRQVHIFNAKIDLLNKATLAFIGSLAAALLGVGGPLTFLGLAGSIFMNWQVTKSLALPCRNNQGGAMHCFPNDSNYRDEMASNGYVLPANYEPVQVDFFGLILWGNSLPVEPAAALQASNGVQASSGQASPFFNVFGKVT